MDKLILKRLGMTDYETEIFLCLISNRLLSVYEISKKTGLYRQVCYDSLNRLQEKGFVSNVLKNGRKIFKATSPDKILNFLEEEVEQYKSIVPELVNLQSNFESENINVEVFKGKNIIRIILRDIIKNLKKGDEVLCTAVDESFAVETDKTTIEQYERDILFYKIRERVILKKGTKGIFNQKNTKYKFIDEKYFNPNPILICKDIIYVLMWGNPNYLIKISSKKISESFKRQFEFMWAFSKKLRG